MLTLKRLENALGQLRVVMPDPKEPNKRSARALRALFTTIQEHRNEVTKVAGALIPRLSRLRADLLRVEGVIGVESASLVCRALIKGANAERRKAELREELRDWYESRDQVLTDVALVEGLLSYTKWVRDELKSSFEIASRLLAEIQLEHQISTGER